MIARWKTKHIFQHIATSKLGNGSGIFNSLLNLFHIEKRQKPNNLINAPPTYNQRLSLLSHLLKNKYSFLKS